MAQKEGNTRIVRNTVVYSHSRGPGWRRELANESGDEAEAGQDDEED
jgi:hypothetical protein